MARKTVLVDDHCMGTYVHGILDNTSFIDYLLKPFADQLAKDSTPFDYHAFKRSNTTVLPTISVNMWMWRKYIK